MLNPALDQDALAREFEKDQRIRIPDVLEPEIAERIRSICASKVPFDFLYFIDGRNTVSSAEEMSARDARTKAEISQKLTQNARQGIGFLYCGYLLNRKCTGDDHDEDLAFLEEVFAYLNSPDMLAFIARVSGRQDVVRADGQCTRYSAGQYLTRHQDVIDGQARRLAYVFGFTKEWHPDWGGLLQFFRNDGTPRDAWVPSFNCLVLFDVRHVHSVTYVTPFAGADRLSITGWFHAANPP